MKSKNFIIVLIIICSIEIVPQYVGDAYAININNIYLPMNRRGILADVNVPPLGSGGQFGGHTFLFSGGFFLSGFSNGQLWANAVASASLVEDYLQGTYQFGQSDPRAQLYKIRSDDSPFGQSWQNWIDAVALGADFYDGDGDQVFNPVDLNGNNQWDTNEDRPDLIGDEMLWCVFHDSRPSSQRRWNTVEPQGIEIRQTVFAYENISELENIIFIRYRIKYVGLGLPTEPDVLDSVFFGVWDDPDIGTGGNDLVGCDTLLTGQFTYNWYSDPIYGNNPPSFFVKKLAGPVTYIPGVTFLDNNGNGIYDEGIDTPLDTAYVHRGQLLGIKEYPGAKNLELSSAVHYINGDINLNDPNTKEEARNYMLGLTRLGELINPCTWTYGQVLGGVDCSQVNPKFWYSGDPVTNYGWICVGPRDQRQVQNMGPFTLQKGNETEIFVAYAVGQGTDYLTSITESKNVSRIAGVLYNSNFDTSSVVSVDEISSGNMPIENFYLFQNFPNPFNPSTKIKFTIPTSPYPSPYQGEGTSERSLVTLIVFDVLGNEIATLINEEKLPGSYEILFNANGLTSGVYFYKVQAGDLTETKKMVLLK